MELKTDVSVQEIIKATESSHHTVGESKVIRLRDEVFSMVHLGEAKGTGNTYSSLEKITGLPVVIVDYADRKVRLGVARLFGNEEIVIKSLSRQYKEIEGFIGLSKRG
ncbi:MAG TPA: hypothetical protein ENI15_10015 [Spirochaetes bacterium]|nr:hypothetical protein [Spirochaetota bacterium]